MDIYTSSKNSLIEYFYGTPFRALERDTESEPEEQALTIANRLNRVFNENFPVFYKCLGNLHHKLAYHACLHLAKQDKTQRDALQFIDENATKLIRNTIQAEWMPSMFSLSFHRKTIRVGSDVAEEKRTLSSPNYMSLERSLWRYKITPLESAHMLRMVAQITDVITPVLVEQLVNYFANHPFTTKKEKICIGLIEKQITAIFEKEFEFSHSFSHITLQIQIIYDRITTQTSVFHAIFFKKGKTVLLSKKMDFHNPSFDTTLFETLSFSDFSQMMRRTKELLNQCKPKSLKPHHSKIRGFKRMCKNAPKSVFIEKANENDLIREYLLSIPEAQRESTALVLGKAYSLDRMYQDTHNTFYHAQNLKRFLLAILMKELEKALHPQKDFSLFKPLRMEAMLASPEEKANLVRLIQSPEFGTKGEMDDHTHRTHLLSVSAKLFHPGDSDWGSMSYYLTQKGSVLDEEHGEWKAFKNTLRMILQAARIKPTIYGKVIAAFHTLFHSLPETGCHIVYVIAIENKKIEQKPEDFFYVSHPRGKKCICHGESNHLDVLKKLQKAEDKSTLEKVKCLQVLEKNKQIKAQVPTVRLFTDKLPEADIHMISPLPENTMKQYKILIGNLVHALFESDPIEHE